MFAVKGEINGDQTLCSCVYQGFPSTETPAKALQTAPCAAAYTRSKASWLVE